jgi:hypothetical protein
MKIMLANFSESSWLVRMHRALLSLPTSLQGVVPQHKDDFTIMDSFFSFNDTVVVMMITMMISLATTPAVYKGSPLEIPKPGIGSRSTDPAIFQPHDISPHDSAYDLFGRLKGLEVFHVSTYRIH